MQKRKPKLTPRVVSTKPLGGAGAEPAISAKIGGVGNKPGAKDERK